MGVDAVRETCYYRVRAGVDDEFDEMKLLERKLLLMHLRTKDRFDEGESAREKVQNL
jgi:hypothetical protein